MNHFHGSKKKMAEGVGDRLWQVDGSSIIRSHMLLNADYGGPRWCLLTTCTLSTVAPRCVHPGTQNVEQFVVSCEPRLMKHSFYGLVNETTASGSLRTDLNGIQQPL